MIETTLRIPVDLSHAISVASRTERTSRSRVIILLLKTVMADLCDAPKTGRAVRYQARSDKRDWRVIHVCFREDEYEYFLDLRKAMKMSVSHILSCAIRKYLLERNTWEKPDNNRFVNYVMIKDVIDHIVHWRFIWGYPPKIELHLR